MSNDDVNGSREVQYRIELGGVQVRGCPDCIHISPVFRWDGNIRNQLEPSGWFWFRTLLEKTTSRLAKYMYYCAKGRHFISRYYCTKSPKTSNVCNPTPYNTAYFRLPISEVFARQKYSGIISLRVVIRWRRCNQTVCLTKWRPQL